MEFAKGEVIEKTREDGDAHVLSNKKINAIATYILRRHTCDDSLRGTILDFAKKMFPNNDDPYRKVGDTLFAMNVEDVQRECATRPTLRLRGRIMPHYKFRHQKASLIYVYDAVKEMQEQCGVGELFYFLGDLRQVVADDIIDSNRELLAAKVVASLPDTNWTT